MEILYFLLCYVKFIASIPSIREKSPQEGEPFHDLFSMGNNNTTAPNPKSSKNTGKITKRADKFHFEKQSARLSVPVAINGQKLSLDPDTSSSVTLVYSDLSPDFEERMKSGLPVYNCSDGLPGRNRVSPFSNHDKEHTWDNEYSDGTVVKGLARRSDLSIGGKVLPDYWMGCYQSGNIKGAERKSSPDGVIGLGLTRNNPMYPKEKFSRWVDLAVEKGVLSSPVFTFDLYPITEASGRARIVWGVCECDGRAKAKTLKISPPTSKKWTVNGKNKGSVLMDSGSDVFLFPKKDVVKLYKGIDYEIEKHSQLGHDLYLVDCDQKFSGVTLTLDKEKETIPGNMLYSTEWNRGKVQDRCVGPFQDAAISKEQMTFGRSFFYTFTVCFHEDPRDAYDPNTKKGKIPTITWCPRS